MLCHLRNTKFMIRTVSLQDPVASADVQMVTVIRRLLSAAIRIQGIQSSGLVQS